MAFYTVEKRMRADGTPRYRCTVGVKQSGKYVYRENKTFGKLSQAKSWGMGRVAHIEANGTPNDERSTHITLAHLIHKYTNHPNIKYGRSKADVLKLLSRSEISSRSITELTAAVFIEHCEQRRSNGAGPATVAQDLAYLGSVLKAAKPIFNIDVDLQAYELARKNLSQMRVVGPSQKRSRRPTRIETELLLSGLKAKEPGSYNKTPFADIFLFSILTCMRIGEVCKITWDDVNEKQKSVLVRDRKDPRKKIGNHMSVPLLGDAWVILHRQPRNDARVFPFNSRSVTQTYRQVRDGLGIDDLRYHDLRREGASRLFEAGFSIEEVAQVTGHRSLNLLWQVYTELYPKSLHEKFEQLQTAKSQERGKNITVHHTSTPPYG
ncbi:tyrosine-type recombinase/integrase [Serratia marcescens]|uniref:tyrosine-type recombinase/integrase n=1 Tax=Serratia marcescens TaxID=615 RepID=UPI002880E959|nr:site-specific integrase [Serratia marcescens]MDT0206990.1 site-specific integrase [Serratia marcescens]